MGVDEPEHEASFFRILAEVLAECPPNASSPTDLDVHLVPRLKQLIAKLLDFSTTAEGKFLFFLFAPLVP